MSKTYNWGIIGLGRIAHKFAQDLQRLPNARLWAVAATSADRAAAFAGQYNAPHHFGSYEELVNVPDLDIVYIATPHVLHKDNTLLCLQHKIPVLCEKPFAMTQAQAQLMVQAARQNDTFLMEAMWSRFMPTIRQALAWIKEGRIGRVHAVKADFGFRAAYEPEGRLLNKALGGGALLDIGVYPAFLALLVLGYPTQIKALATLGPTGVDEELGAVLKYEDGKLAHLHTSIRAKTKTEAFIYGDEGVIHLHSRWHEPSTMSLIIEGQRPELLNFDYNGLGYHYEAAEAMKCLDQGLREHPDLTLDFSLQLMQLLDDIRKEAGVPLE